MNRRIAWNLFLVLMLALSTVCTGSVGWAQTLARMNVTTVGAAIFPVTAVGKVVCVLLPIVGMIFFPIFTVYISQYYTGKKSSN